MITVGILLVQFWTTISSLTIRTPRSLIQPAARRLGALRLIITIILLSAGLEVNAQTLCNAGCAEQLKRKAGRARYDWLGERQILRSVEHLMNTTRATWRTVTMLWCVSPAPTSHRR